MNPGLPQPDFLHPVRRPGRLAWAWCGTGVLVLLLAAVDGQAAWQQRRQALAELAHAGRAVPGAAGAGPATAAGRPGAAATLAARQDAEARRWQQQLARPWAALWAAGELAPPGLRWLSVEHGGNGTLRLSGEAADLAPAQAVAAALRLQQHQGVPVWQDVALANAQRVPAGQRVELVARLAPALAGAGR